MSAFKTAYASLNPVQKKAVDTIEGPVMVIAGPGTGKTQIIATRIANILKQTDADPSTILALTYTDSGATAMRQRLLSLIGSDAYKIAISTFHSFASSIIQNYPDFFVKAPASQPLGDLERFGIIEHILQHRDFKLLKPINTPLYYSSAIIAALQDLKREGVNPQNFNRIIKKDLKQLERQRDRLSPTEFNLRHKQLLKNLDLLEIYHLYQKELTRLGRYDFEDMINWVLEAFSTDPELLSLFQERFQYFLVDEYQDTNSAQNRLIDLLTSYWGQQANLFVVGDPNQSIFRFQGANLENILNFLHRYPQTQTINLTDNYRSQPTILAAAQKIAASSPFSHQLIAALPLPSQPIKLVRTTHPTLEHHYLAQEVKTLLDQGTKPSQIAIIARHNADLPPLADLFTHFHLPFQIQGGEDILTTSIVKYLLKLLRVIHRSRTAADNLDLFTLLHYPFFNFNPLDILKLSRAAALKKTTLFGLINSPYLDKTVSRPQDFIDFTHRLSVWNQLETTTPFVEFFEKLLSQSGLLSWLLKQKDSSVHLTHLNTFFNLIKQLNSADHQLNLDSFLKNLELMEQNHLKIVSPELELNPDKITLTTAHKAKGLEWEYVFLFSCTDGKWGNQRDRQLIRLPSGLLQNQPQEADHLAEERRLFYVALTRAKLGLTICYTQISLPSQFISQIPSTHLQPIAYQSDPTELNQLRQILVTPAPEPAVPSEAEFLRSSLKDFILSPTALNTYLECPYKFKLNNLLRLPRRKEPYLSFGTAVHAALERFHCHHQQTEALPAKDFLLQEFETALNQEILSPSESKACLAEGRNILSAYYHHHLEDVTAPPLFIEKFFGYGYSKIYLGDIPIGGKIDRIDWVDPQAQTVKVIDYKTGKRKTRGQIEGKTQTSRGHEKRQLVFYQLLADLDPRFPLKVARAELDFVASPYLENRSGKEAFEIAAAEIDDLKKVIIEITVAIRSLKFPRTSDHSTCQHCELIDHCWPQGLKTTAQNFPDS